MNEGSNRFVDFPQHTLRFSSVGPRIGFGGFGAVVVLFLKRFSFYGFKGDYSQWHAEIRGFEPVKQIKHSLVCSTLNDSRISSERLFSS